MIVVKEGPDRLVLAVAGDLDHHGTSDLRHHRATRRSWPDQVELDLSAVGFIDSSGIGELLTYERLITRSGSRLVLRPSDEVARLLTRLCLDDHFGVPPREADDPQPAG